LFNLIRLNLQENRIHRELTIDTIISFMNIIWWHLYSWIGRVKIFLVIFILFIRQSDIIRRS